MISDNLYENMKYLKELNKSPDYKFKEIKISNHKICLVSIESLVSSDRINDYILKSISYLIENNKLLIFKNLMNYFTNILPAINVVELNSLEEISKYLHLSFTIILFDNETRAIAIETRGNLDRGINSPSIEKSVSGPQDAFNENIIINTGLIRRRIKSEHLEISEVFVGRQTKTKLNILSMSNICDNKLLKRVLRSLKKIDIDGIIDNGTVKELISTSKSSFPDIKTTERPDLICKALLEGRVCIMCENSPTALIIPTFLGDYFRNPDDSYQRYKNITFIKIIRFISFLLAVLTPALYIAITTYNLEAIPNNLLVNFASQRESVPFPAVIEAIGMTLVFEILRESDMRMPNQMGSSIGILGAIILGDAAVSAGIVSPIMVIVIAVTAISGLIFSNIELVNAVRLWRFIFIIFATFLGMPGIIICGFLFTMILVSANSFGKPFMYPLSPLNFKMAKKYLTQIKEKKNLDRDILLAEKNKVRQKI